MNFLDNLVDSFKTVFMSIALDIFIKVVNDQITEEMLFEVGRKGGIFVTDHARAGLGDKWDSIEEVIESKLWALQSGFESGLDHDDKATAENNETPPQA